MSQLLKLLSLEIFLSGLGTSIFSNVFDRCKTSAITILLHRAYEISSSDVLFDTEIHLLRMFSLLIMPYI